MVGAPDHSYLRWTVDRPDDLEFVRAVYGRLDAEGRIFGMDDVLALLRREPGLLELLAGLDGDEGYRRSLARDAV